MFADLWFALRKLASRRPQRLRSTSRLYLEPLEDRLPLSGGLVTGSDPSPTSGSNVSGSQQVAIVGQSGGPGPSGGQGTSGGSGSSSLFLSGVGYPLAPTTGPARPDPSTLSQPPQTTVMVPLTGTPGGPYSIMAVVPVCTGGGPASPPAG